MQSSAADITHKKMYAGTENFISRLTPEILVNGVPPVKLRERYEIKVMKKRITDDAKKTFPRYS